MRWVILATVLVAGCGSGVGSKAFSPDDTGDTGYLDALETLADLARRAASAADLVTRGLRADRFATVGATVMIEPINSRIDMPGYWLDDVDKGFRLLESIDRSNVKLQLDLYHAQIIQGDLARTIEYHRVDYDIESSAQRIFDAELALNFGKRLFLGVFMVGSALAGLGGIMWALYREEVHASIGGELTVLVFIVIIIGGLGSIGGCFIGAILVAMVANYGGFLVPKLALISNILLMVAVLMWRPRGLYPVTNR